MLRALGALALDGRQVFEVAAPDDAALDALARSEALRELRHDQMVFRHDVLREWAIANTLAEDAARLLDLPLDHAGSPALVRGLELAARFSLEKTRDLGGWRATLAAVSGGARHPSWRRAVLLSPLRSDILDDVLPVLEPAWLEDDAALLREFIPILLAVDVQPIRMLYEAAGVDASAIPEDVTVPRGGAWHRLVAWLLGLGAAVPMKALPEIVDLFACWARVSLIYPDPLTPSIIERFVDWLMAIDQSREFDDWRDLKVAFEDKIAGKELNRIEDEMRMTLALFAPRAPAAATRYLNTLPVLGRKEDIYDKLFKFIGHIARAAPEAMAMITIDALVKPPEAGKRRRESFLDGPLTFLDHQFLPESPAQGPFFELLQHAPAVGVELIRTLIDKAVAFHARDTVPGGYNVFVVEMPDGPRRFLWHFTYGWPRASRYHSITSALMALEAWAHGRVEAGEQISTVIADVIGAPDAPAAYLLIVVDLILSHWPASRAAAVPFVASPDLLATDIGRPVQENIEFPDFYGLKALQREPAGPKLDSLRRRPSRSHSLDVLLFYFATRAEFASERTAIEALLAKARERLGPYEAADTRGHPRFMAFHAQNRINPANYEDVDVPLKGGGATKECQYVPTKEEQEHFAPVHEGVEQRASDAQYSLLINAALDRPDQSSPEFAEKVAAWARQERVAPEDEDTALTMRQAIVGAALIAMRDGTTEFRATNGMWAEGVFAEALTEEPDVIWQMREGLRFNPFAMAFAGRAFALRDGMPTREDFKRLLAMAAGDAAASRGAAPAAETLRALNPRLPRAVLRVALAASVGDLHAWDASDEEKAASEAARVAELARRIEGELNWPLDGGAEPPWAAFPVESVRRRERRVIRLGPPPAEENAIPPRPPVDRYVNQQTAAVWLRALWRPASDPSWLTDFVAVYKDWTFVANGADLDEREEVTDRPDDWNGVFFAVVAESLKGVDAGAMETALAPILALHERNFFDVTDDVLRALDVVFFNDAGIEPEGAVTARRLFAEKLGRYYAWRSLRGTKSDGVEMHLEPAGAAMFFNEHQFGVPPRCYLPAAMIERSLVFLPTMQLLATAAPSPFVAIILMNYLDASPRPEQLPLLLAFADAATNAYPDDRSFWLDHGIGRRMCRWLDGVRTSHHDVIRAERAAVALLVAKLVAVGVAEAHALEIALHANE